MRNIKTLSELEDKYIGKKGTPERSTYVEKSEYAVTVV